MEGAPFPPMATSPHRLTRARHLQDQGRFLAAADVLLAAFRSAPHDGSIACELGHVLLAGGDPAGALEDLDRARHADPRDPAALRGCMEALRQLGRPDQAARALVDGLMAGVEPQELADQILPDLAA